MVNFNFDILSLIFIEAFYTDSTSLSTLRLVKRTWYEIIRRTPQLWTRLVLRRRSHFTDLKYAQLYLQNSGTLPIDIHIMLPDDVDVSEIEGVSDLLRGQSSRFRSFDLHVRIRDELEGFIYFIGKDRPAPLLESLELRVQRCTPCDTVVCFVSPLDAFTPAPHLTHIEIPGWPILEPFPQLSNITSLTIDSMSLDCITIHKVILFLCSTPSLEHFVYKGHGVSNKTVRNLNDSDPRVVHLPNLVTVDVTAPGSGGDVLCLIHAPALRDACIDGFRPHNLDVPWERAPNESLTQIIFLLSTRSRNLQRLTLEYTEFLETPGGFETIFDDISFPQLEEVLLIATDITDEALMKGARRNLGLKRLELRYCDAVTGTSFLEFVQRRGSDFSLSLQHCGHLNMTQEDMEAISEMIEVEGLH